MNKYVLLQAPKAEGDYAAPIEIIDNANAIGKGRVEERLQAGYIHIGWIESDLRIPELKAGLEYYWRRQVEEAHKLFRHIADDANSYLME